MSKRPASATHVAQEADIPGKMLRRDGRYSLRRRIPLDLVPAYGGKAEITRALGTADPVTAKALNEELWVTLTREFRAKRTELAEQARRAALPAVPVDAAEKAAGVMAGLRDRRDKAAAEGKLDEFKDHLSDQLAVHQAVLDGEEEPSWSLAAHEGIRNALRAMQTGDGAAAIGPKPVKIDRTHTPLSAEIDLWAKRKNRPPKTVNSMRRVIGRFETAVGAKAVEEVTRRDVVTFREKMLEDGQTVANTNVMLTFVSALFGHAFDRELIPTNPATKTSLEDSRRAREKRREFDDVALKAIFESPIYSKDHRPLAGAGEAAYWLPLLALYTGARINELCQLHPDNVVQETYADDDGEDRSAWVIRFEEDEARGQHVKTEGSERRVPLHADLIALGFLKVVAAAKAKGLPLIFNELRRDSDGKISGNWSKWFSRYLRGDCGVTDKRMKHSTGRSTPCTQRLAASYVAAAMVRERDDLLG